MSTPWLYRRAHSTIACYSRGNRYSRMLSHSRGSIRDTMCWKETLWVPKAMLLRTHLVMRSSPGQSLIGASTNTITWNRPLIVPKSLLKMPQAWRSLCQLQLARMLAPSNFPRSCLNNAWSIIVDILATLFSIRPWRSIKVLGHLVNNRWLKLQLNLRKGGRRSIRGMNLNYIP